MRLAIVQATDGDSLQEIPLLLCVRIRPVPPLIMNTLGNPHHSLLLGNPHHGLLGNLHHDLLLGNPRHGLLLGNPHHGLLLPPVRAMVDFILQTFPDYQASPSHPSSRSFDFLLLWTRLKRFPSRSDLLVILRMGRLATPFSILSTSLKGSQIRPLRGRN